jgi:hypothetical protein
MTAGHTVVILGQRTQDDGYSAEIVATAFPQAIDCPDCSGLAVWTETGHAPGAHQCQCGTILNCQRAGDMGPIKDGKFAARYVIRRERFL